MQDKVNGKKPQPLQDQPPPQDQMPRVLAGPAERQVQVIHGNQLAHRGKDAGVFWDCPKCGKRCDVYGQNVHNAVGVGEDVPVRCGKCSTWVLAGKQHVAVFSDQQATALIRRMVKAS